MGRINTFSAFMPVSKLAISGFDFVYIKLEERERRRLLSFDFGFRGFMNFS